MYNGKSNEIGKCVIRTYRVLVRDPSFSDVIQPVRAVIMMFHVTALELARHMIIRRANLFSELPAFRPGPLGKPSLPL